MKIVYKYLKIINIDNGDGDGCVDNKIDILYRHLLIF